jgi:hypothetical protein
MIYPSDFVSRFFLWVHFVWTKLVKMLDASTDFDGNGRYKHPQDRRHQVEKHSTQLTYVKVHTSLQVRTRQKQRMATCLSWHEESIRVMPWRRSSYIVKPNTEWTRGPDLKYGRRVVSLSSCSGTWFLLGYIYFSIRFACPFFICHVKSTHDVDPPTTCVTADEALDKSCLCGDHDIFGLVSFNLSLNYEKKLLIF